MNELIIKIYEGTDERGFFYDIYDTDTDDENKAIEGGFCTTTIENALQMATAQALDLIRAKK
jgi:hypothetical protein